MAVLVGQPHDHERQHSEERPMLLRHVVPNDRVPFAFHAITYASETLDRLLAGVKGRRCPRHDSAAIMDARPEKNTEAPVYFSAEKAVGVRI
jgi:hypothetical protein